MYVIAGGIIREIIVVARVVQDDATPTAESRNVIGQIIVTARIVEVDTEIVVFRDVALQRIALRIEFKVEAVFGVVGCVVACEVVVATGIIEEDAVLIVVASSVVR